MNTLHDRIRGSLVGGAIGDALGYPVEKMTLQEIRNKYGNAGITYYEVSSSGKAVFSNETQMALFTANALLYGDTRLCMRGIGPRHWDIIFGAHVEWEGLHEGLLSKNQHNCWIRDIANLKNVERGYAIDKGLRLSPIGLWAAANVARGESWTYKDVIKYSYDCCFRSPYGYFSSVYLPMLLFCLCSKDEEISLVGFEQMIQHHCSVIPDIIPDELNASGCGMELEKSECLELIGKVVGMAANSLTDEDNIKSLGEGRSGDNLLAIALYCVMRHFDSFENAIIAAANHDGYSKVSAAICGSIMGAIYGYDAIPSKYKDYLELSDVVIALADDLTQGCIISEYSGISQPEQVQWMSRYIDMYPYGFPHLELTEYDFRYPVPGIYDKVGEWWPDIDVLLKENLPEFFYFNDSGAEYCSKQEAILCFWWPCTFRIEDVSYHSVGHFMEAEKARIFRDMFARKRILCANSKQDILDLGKQIKGFDEKIWTKYRNAVALYGNYHKFKQNMDCKKALLDTKELILIYDSKETEWGIEYDRTDERIQNPENWYLDNLLGYSLMTIRDLLDEGPSRGQTQTSLEYVFSSEDLSVIESFSSDEEKRDYKLKLINERKFGFRSHEYNQSGSFAIQGGGLIEFVPKEGNIALEEGDHLVLKNIFFPYDNIVRIADGLFSDIKVIGNVELPKVNLKEIGKKGGEKGVFVNCEFLKLYIPSDVTLLGDYAFSKCRIGILKLYPAALKGEYGRQFKGASIDKLFLPESSLPMSCSDFGVLRSIVVNAVVKDVYLDHLVHMSWDDFIRELN